MTFWHNWQWVSNLETYMYLGYQIYLTQEEFGLSHHQTHWCLWYIWTTSISAELEKKEFETKVGHLQGLIYVSAVVCSFERPRQVQCSQGGLHHPGRNRVRVCKWTEKKNSHSWTHELELVSTSLGNFLLVAPQTHHPPSKSVQKSDKGGPLGKQSWKKLLPFRHCPKVALTPPSFWTPLG